MDWQRFGNPIEGEIVMIEPRWIHPPHEVRDHAKHQRLVESMKRSGWKGRPLLVEHIQDDAYMGWTGSHRISAAKEADLYEVPTIVVDSDALDALAERDSTRFRDQFGLWAGAPDDDWDMVEMLREAGDKPSAQLAEQEAIENE